MGIRLSAAGLRGAGVHPVAAQSNQRSRPMMLRTAETIPEQIALGYYHGKKTHGTFVLLEPGFRYGHSVFCRLLPDSFVSREVTYHLLMGNFGVPFFGISTPEGCWKNGAMACAGKETGGNPGANGGNVQGRAGSCRGGAGGRWWARRDLNPQPRDYESPALTVELQAPCCSKPLHPSG